AGGVGKTRLATEVAGELAGDFADGVWFVDLAPITDRTLVPQTVATALELVENPGRHPRDTLLDYLRDRQLLIVLDNCQHLGDAWAHLAVSLLPEPPGLRIRATGRAPIGLTGGAVYRVPSLAVPPEVDGGWSGAREAGGVDGSDRSGSGAPNPQSPTALRAPA